MKKIVIVLIVLLFISVSITYRYIKIHRLSNYPIIEEKAIIMDDSPLFLYIYFTRNTCKPCMEIIKVLNRLKDRFNIYGVVPKQDLREEADLRAETGASFRLIEDDNYMKFIPEYYPSLVGVSAQRKILFVIPGVPGESQYLENFLEEFVKKARPLLFKKNEY